MKRLYQKLVRAGVAVKAAELPMLKIRNVRDLKNIGIHVPDPAKKPKGHGVTIQNWLEGNLQRQYKAPKQFWFDGERGYSYETLIGVRDLAGRKLELDRHKYSPTTSRIQGIIGQTALALGYEIEAKDLQTEEYYQRFQRMESLSEILAKKLPKLKIGNKRDLKNIGLEGEKPGDLPRSSWPKGMVLDYLIAAMWASTDGGDPIDDNYGIEDLAVETVKDATKECEAFEKEARKAIGDEAYDELNEEYVGHDFWLTRNGCGTGFWDRPEMYGKENAEKLEEIAKKFGESTMYIGDDERVYIG